MASLKPLSLSGFNVEELGLVLKSLYVYIYIYIRIGGML